MQTIQSLSRTRLRQAQEMQALARIKEQTSSPPKTPFHVQGMEFTPEGVETPTIAGSEVEISFPLPADEVRWNLKPNRYRVMVRTQGPAVLDLTDPETGDTIIRSRRSSGRAVLDIEASAVELTSTTPIQDIDIHRFDRRGTAEMIVGPFTAEGIVEAGVAGHGDWTVDVASDPMVEGEVDVADDPVFEGPGTPWYGQPPGDDQTPRPAPDMVPWSVARRFPGAPDLSLRFHEELQAGVLLSEHEEVEIEQTTPTGDHYYWRGLGDWRVMGGSDAPAFDPRPALWTYVWGRVSGADKAYDLRTGKRAQPTSEGTYVVRTDEPGAVDIEGRHASYARPISSEDRSTMLPGTYTRAKRHDAPERVFVRIRGSGLAREIKLNETKRYGPDGLEIATTRRIDLADYFRPGVDREHNLTMSGPGVFLAGTAR